MPFIGITSGSTCVVPSSESITFPLMNRFEGLLYEFLTAATRAGHKLSMFLMASSRFKLLNAF